MITYITGKLIEKNPAYVIIETAGGVAYYIHISLNTFSQIKSEETLKLLTHHVVKEDSHLLYGFIDAEERSFFRLLISVSGIGPNTARLILSSLSVGELSQAIANEDEEMLKVERVGPKKAQRLIFELKDKITKIETLSNDNFSKTNNNNKNEALSALISLGFAKNTGEVVLEKIIKSEGNDLSVEELIKKALKLL
ncbi:MAG TPA: Holliday junction branch migration protein RuvA [Bacteroidales bacterium]|nr:Holliday junction branch migration protein RuvA [Bacteroidales bacterium]HOS58258.1 Holliday junction branch migration protein RuvA [Bacteroidales bacterium]HRR04816.1 Holliday junction branch migration protein RuvA [Bacteroidales bacterium]HRT13835.1 Holliday junction branch migration protein RuvA [Bacteroidales bacterium]HXK73450.1 Holliday junction branch migration protein RuvA [Bacteroidales bacterium]